MVTFSPMLSVAGNVGQIWRIIPLITIVVLIFSLVESLTILPAHLGHLKDHDNKNKRKLSSKKALYSWGPPQSNQTKSKLPYSFSI